MIWSFIQNTSSYILFRTGVKQVVLFSRAKKKMKEARIGGELNMDSRAIEVYATFELRRDG
jgi:hypothetical protein